MTQEDKELLLKDLCARLPYGVIVLDEPAGYFGKLLRIDFDSFYYDGEEDEEWQTIWNVKPYLRPMSSMTEEERKYYNYLSRLIQDGEAWEHEVVDWLNKHHFDYRGLIEKGLALEAKEGMYKFE